MVFSFNSKVFAHRDMIFIAFLYFLTFLQPHLHSKLSCICPCHRGRLSRCQNAHCPDVKCEYSKSASEEDSSVINVRLGWICVVIEFNFVEVGHSVVRVVVAHGALKKVFLRCSVPNRTQGKDIRSES